MLNICVFVGLCNVCRLFSVINLFVGDHNVDVIGGSELCMRTLDICWHAYVSYACTALDQHRKYLKLYSISL